MLTWISDYFELGCWNSCSFYDDMFEYMNLMIIEWLLMKLHVHDMYKWVYCELCLIWWIVLCYCWFIIEFMIMDCDCCLLLLLMSYHSLSMNLVELFLLDCVELAEWIVVVVKTCCFKKNHFISISKLIQMLRNERVRRVRASGHASDNFWQMGILNIRF